MLDMIRDLYRIERIAKDKAEAKGTETALFQARKTVVHVSIESKNSLDLNTVRNNVKMVGHRGRWWCFRIAVRSPVSAPARHGRSWYCH